MTARRPFSLLKRHSATAVDKMKTAKYHRLIEIPAGNPENDRKNRVKTPVSSEKYR